MAQKEELIPDKTFYLYDYSNVLVKRTKKIYSPYNVKTLWRTPSEDYFSDPDFVEFKNGQYTVSKNLWSVRYKQQIEWLSLYNTTGGQLKEWVSSLHQNHLNGRFYKNDWIHQVHAEKIETWPKVETNTVIEKVEVQQIPLIIANNMNVKQLQELASAWAVELPENILDLWDVEKIKETIIKIMTESWNIK